MNKNIKTNLKKILFNEVSGDRWEESDYTCGGGWFEKNFFLNEVSNYGGGCGNASGFCFSDGRNFYESIGDFFTEESLIKEGFVSYSSLKENELGICSETRNLFIDYEECRNWFGEDFFDGRNY